MPGSSCPSLIAHVTLGKSLSLSGTMPCVRSCPTLCDPMDYSPSGSSVHGILQARILEWIAISSSRDLPDPGTEPMSPVSPAPQLASLPAEPLGKLLWDNKWPPLCGSETCVSSPGSTNAQVLAGGGSGGRVISFPRSVSHPSGRTAPAHPVILRRGTADGEDGGDIM